MSGAGSTGGPGSTGPLRDDPLREAGSAGSRPMSDRTPGTGEVHSGLSVGRDVDTGYSAIAAAGSTGASTGSSSWEPASGSDRSGALNRVRDVAEQARDHLQGMTGNVSDRVGDATERARDTAGQFMGRAEQVLEERGVLDRVRENPLPALGLAVGVGFLLAGSGEKPQGKRGGTLYKAKNQLKGAIMGGLSAAVAQEGRNLLGMMQGQKGQGGLLEALFEGLQGGGSRGPGGGIRRRPSHEELR